MRRGWRLRSLVVGKGGAVAVAAAGVSGFIGGIWVERHLRDGQRPPPDIITLLAATPLTPTPPTSLDNSPAPPKAGWLPDPSSKPTPQPSRVSQIMRWGFPGMDNVRSFNDYVVSYDRRNRVPHWVAEHLTSASVKSNPEVDRGRCDFHEDLSIHPYFRSTNADYKGSGLDRGHMAAAGNHRLHQGLVEETFSLSNIAPQVGKGFNRDSWNRLEKYVRGMTKRYDNVWVITGPLYLPQRDEGGKMMVKYQVIGKSNVAVPSHFFKVIVAEQKGALDLEAYIMPNAPIDDKAPLDAFRVPVDAVERAAGLLFFDRVPKGTFRQINGRRG